MMRVYYPDALERPGIRTISVAPAATDPTARVPEWQDPNGDPITLHVRFVHGVADVDDALGRFLIAHKHARKSRPLLVAA